jgi:uncharacterized membrane protein HdeD (DUF308 family)
LPSPFDGEKMGRESRIEVTMDVSVVVGIVFVVAGIGFVVSALPITHHLARLLPQWTMTRGDVDRLGSTTFLTASIGMLMTVAGVALILFAIVTD